MIEPRRRNRKRPLLDHVLSQLPSEKCVLWPGALNRTGYGLIRHPLGRVAHRVVFLLTGGVIPEGFQTDHLCRTPACVNPAHLEPVTARENLLRAGMNAAKTHCKRGHEFTPENTRESSGVRGPYRVCRACHRESVKKHLLAKATA